MDGQHKFYLDVVEDSKPLWLTKMLGKRSMLFFVGLILIIYWSCYNGIMKHKLYKLDLYKVKDILDPEEESTKKYFVS